MAAANKYGVVDCEYEDDGDVVIVGEIRRPRECVLVEESDDELVPELEVVAENSFWWPTGETTTPLSRSELFDLFATPPMLATGVMYWANWTNMCTPQQP